MAFFSSDDSEVRKRVEQLEKTVKQKDALHTTLESSYLKLESDLKACKESLKTSQYNLSVETRKAAEAETALDKTRKETKDHASQRHNFEATIRNQEKSLEERQREVKQLQRDLERAETSSGDSTNRFAAERDAFRNQTKKLQAECDALRAAQPQTSQVPVPNTTVKELEVQIAALQSENDVLRTKETASDDPKKRRRRRSSSFSGLYERPPATDDRELQQLKSKYTKSERELLQTSNALAALQKSSKQDMNRLQQNLEDTQDDLRDTQDTLKDTQQQLQAAREEQSKASDQACEHARQTESLKQQIETLENLQTAKNDEAASLNSNIDRLRSEHEELVATSQQASRDFTAAKSDLEKVNAVKFELESKVEELTFEVTEATTLFEVSASAAKELKEERDHLLKQMMEKDERLKVLDAQVQEIPRIHQDAALAEQRVQFIEAELETTTNQYNDANAALQSARAHAKHKTEQYDTLSQQYEHMQREMEEHSQSQETFVQERKKLLEECQSAHEQRVAALETCHETQQERDDLSERLAEIQVELQSFKDNHSYEDVYVLELEDLYESKAARVQHLEAALHQAETLEEESSSARAAAAREVSRLEEEVQNLKDAQQDAETSRQGHGFAREVERTEAQAALEGTQTQLCHLEQLLEGKSQEVDRLEHELREAERHSTELIQELQTFKEQFSLLEGDLKTTRNELETCKTDFSQRISEAAEETESLLESLQEAGKREVKLQADYDKAVEDLQEVDIELASLRSALNDQQHEDTITALKNELYQAQTALEQAQEPAVEEEEQEEEAEVVAELLSQQSMVQSSPIRQRRRSRHSTTPNTPQRNLATATILVARLRAERDSAKADGEFAQAEQSIALQKLRSQVAELREANAQLEGHLQQLRSLPSETSDMEASLQRMTVERDELSHTLENQSSKVRSLEDQVAKAEAHSASSYPVDKTGLPSHTKQLVRKQAELESRVERRNEQIGKLQTELSQVRSNLAMAEDSISSLESMVDVVRDEAKAAQDAAEKTLKQGAEETTAQRQSLADKDIEIRELTSAKSDIEQKLACTVENLESARRSLHENALALNEAEDMRQRAEEGAEVAQQTIHTLNQHVKELEEHSLRLSEEHATAMVDLKTAKEQAMMDLAQCQQTVDRLESEQLSLQSRVDALQSTAATDRTASDDLVTGLKQSLDAAEHSSVSLQNRLDATEETLRAQRSDAERSRVDADRIRQEMKTLRSLVAQKDASLQELERVLQETRTEAENLIGDFNLCSSELERELNERETIKQQNHDLATRLGKAESDYTTLTSRFQDLETDLELARSHLKEEKAAREDDALRLQEMEESLQQQQEEMEETDDRYLHTLKDIKKLQESYERLQVRCEYLQRQVVDLESFRRSALQTQQEQQSTSNRAVAASVATPTPPVSARQPSSSSAKKRSIPEDFENHGAAPVRAIAVSSSPQKNASRPVVSLKNKNSIESKISKRPMPLGSARQPLRSEVVNKPQDLSATGVERSQSSKLRANLAALQSQHPQRV